MENRKNIMHRS